MTPAEHDAIQADAATSLKWLQEQERRLLPDADDPECLSELTWIQERIQLAQAQLTPPTATQAIHKPLTPTPPTHNPTPAASRLHSEQAHPRAGIRGYHMSRALDKRSS